MNNRPQQNKPQQGRPPQGTGTSGFRVNIDERELMTGSMELPR